jgi:hypothetical protein
MIVRSRRIAPLRTLVVASIVFAAAAGVVAVSPKAASAATHCTRYAPTPVPSPDIGCYNKGQMSTQFYRTPSVALRDENFIDINGPREPT